MGSKSSVVCRLKPLLISPRIFSSGISQSSNTSSQVFEPLIPSLSSF